MNFMSTMKQDVRSGLDSMDDAMRERLAMLKSKEKKGNLTDSDRNELQRLLERFPEWDKR